MKRFIEYTVSRPIIGLSVLIIGSLLAAFQLPKVKVNVGADGMMKAGDPDKAFYEATLDTFGSDNIMVVFVQDKDLFEPERLEAIQEVALELEDIPGVRKVDSLFNLQNFKDEDGMLATDPFLEEIPDDPDDLAAVTRDALRNPLVKRNAISTDAKVMAINVYVQNEGDEDFDKNISNAIQETIAPLEGKVDRVFQMGMPFTRKVLGEKIIGDQIILTPLAVTALVIALIVCLRTLNSAVLPLLTSGLSVLWTLGMMGAAGLPINLLTAIVPALIIVIGSTEDIHLLSEYTEGVAEGHDPHGAVLFMAGKLGLAILLTFATTYLGFFSIAFNDITMLKQFGIVASSGLAFNFVVTMMLTPIYLKRFGAKKAKKHSGTSIFTTIAEHLIANIRKHRAWALAFAILVALVIGAGTFRVIVNNSMLGYFKLSSPVRQRANTVAERLCGMQSFYIVLTAQEEETEEAFRDPHFLKEIWKLQGYIKKTGLFDASFSIADYMALINREMKGGDDKDYTIPDNKELIAQYLMLLRQPDVEQYVSSDYQQANILVRHHIAFSGDLADAIDEIKKNLHRLDGRIQVKFTGEEILTNKAADSIAAGQVKSLLVLIAIIFIVMSVIFLNPKAGALSIVPNAFPVMVLFGLMGYFKIPLDVGTAMIASIAIGIAIDDTIHFMIRYNKEMRETADEALALERTVKAEAQPVISTSIALALGFSVLMSSSFVPLIWFGALTAILMGVALLADLVITPILLSYTRFVTLADMISVQIGKDVINNCNLFTGLTERQIKKVVLLSKVRDIKAGEVFIKQGAPGKEMFIILEGTAHAEKELSSGRVKKLGSFKAGQILGEIALVYSETRTATVVAETDGKLLVLEWAALEQLAKAVPKISTRLFLNISRIICRRLLKSEEH